MEKIRFYLLTLFISLLLPACQTRNSDTPKVPKEIVIELTMPQAVTIDELPDKIHYYWQPGDLVNLRIQGGEEEITLKEVAPQLTSDGLKGRLQVKLPTGMPATGLTIAGEVVRRDYSTTPTLVAYMAPLPTKVDKSRFNMRKAGIQIPLYFHQSGVDATDGSMSLELSTIGYFAIIEIANGTTIETQLPKGLSLTSSTPWLRKAPQPVYDHAHKSFRGEKCVNDLPLTSPSISLPPKAHIKLLLWLPEESKGTPVTALAEGMESATVPFEELLTITLREGGQLDLREGLLHPIPADISRGGDPTFTFEDIRYWVGSGSKRAALVTDWHLADGKEAMVWGYRFDGEKSAGKMLEEIANNDPRFHIAIGYSGTFRDDQNNALFGIAYQPKPSPKPFQILYQDKPLEQRSKGVFFIDTNGKEQETPDLLAINDPTALWQRGFMTNGYWAYFLKDTRLAPFVYANKGMWSSKLNDNSWHALTWSRLGGGSMQGDDLSQLFLPTPPPTDK